jgi:hypothetical protein
MSYLYLKSEYHNPFWSEVQLVGTYRQFVHIRLSHVQSRNPWKMDGAWHRSRFLKIDNLPYPKRPGDEHKLYFNQLLQKTYDLDTINLRYSTAIPSRKLNGIALSSEH